MFLGGDGGVGAVWSLGPWGRGIFRLLYDLFLGDIQQRFELFASALYLFESILEVVYLLRQFNVLLIDPHILILRLIQSLPRSRLVLL